MRASKRARLFSAAGGLAYHLKATRYSRKLWRPFRIEISEWLSDWKPHASEILLIGPSGWHCPNLTVLSNYQKVIAVDLDPVALRIFKLRMLARRRGSRVQRVGCFIQDVLSQREVDRGLPTFERLLSDHPNAAILFCNVLGQVRFDFPEKRLTELMARLRSRLTHFLRGREWASYHDRISTSVHPEVANRLTVDHPMTNREIVSSLLSSTQEGSALDHLTESLLPREKEYTYFVWEITPGYYHIIEGTHTASVPVRKLG